MFNLMNFKGMDIFPHNTRIDFMRFKDLCFLLSILMMAGSLGLFFVRGLNYGVDFTGGSMIELQAKSGKADVADLRGKLGALDVGNVQIQPFGTPADVLVRLDQQPGGEKAQQEAHKRILDAVGADYVLRQTQSVGPAVSSELRMTGLIAILASLLAIGVYVWFRFEWQFAVGGIIALLHDVLLTVGLFALFHLEFDISIVAALLTILGYSINDTVVISDRIRENMRRFKRMELNQLLNLSINETLSRTILTSGITLMSVVCLFIWGGPVIRNFNLAMIFGIVVGTYSTIFIAAPILGYMNVKREAVVGGEPAPAQEKKKRQAGRPAGRS